jgi:hypothetical protein
LVFYIAAAISLTKLLNYPHEADWTPFQAHYFSENLIAPGIKPRTSGSGLPSLFCPCVVTFVSQIIYETLNPFF